MDGLETQDLAHFAILTCAWFPRSLSDLSETFCESGNWLRVRTKITRSGTFLIFEPKNGNQKSRVGGRNDERDKVMEGPSGELRKLCGDEWRGQCASPCRNTWSTVI
jgi:hypothetical protein